MAETFPQLMQSDQFEQTEELAGEVVSPIDNHALMIDADILLELSARIIVVNGVPLKMYPGPICSDSSELNGPPVSSEHNQRMDALRERVQAFNNEYFSKQAKQARRRRHNPAQAGF